MAKIEIKNLTFGYEDSFDNVFENASFSFDSSWKLGLIGRNGKGKTTLAKLLAGEMDYSGSIVSGGIFFDYFPYEVNEDILSINAGDAIFIWKSDIQVWQVICELNKLGVDPEILDRAFETLSQGERTKLMLAVLFSGQNRFLIIDEPTNHLDHEARIAVVNYLSGKKGFILISHDRNLLDEIVDHVLVLNRKTIEVQAGNFSSWWNNKSKRDTFLEAENQKHIREINALKKAADKSARWAQANENTKIGFDPIKEHDRYKDTRAFIGAKTKKIQARVKNYEKRIAKEIEEKEGLLDDIEKTDELKLLPLKYHKESLIYANDLCYSYPGSPKDILTDFCFEIKQGERVFLNGGNGSGKSTFIKLILDTRKGSGRMHLASGELHIGSGLKISYVSQDTSFLEGSLKKYCEQKKIEESLMLAILRQLGMNRTQFIKPIESFSEGQKKKVLIAGSLAESAHIYIWDEPLNYIDVFSRIQIEKLILKYEPTMLIVEHDKTFRDNTATRIIDF